MTRQYHHEAVFAGSQLEAGRQIEELRQRRVGLQRDHRAALLEQEAATVAHGEAASAARLVAGRQLAGLADGEDVKRATAQVRAAERARDKCMQRAEDVAAGIDALEREMTHILVEHRDELEDEIRERSRPGARRCSTRPSGTPRRSRSCMSSSVRRGPCSPRWGRTPVAFRTRRRSSSSGGTSGSWRRASRGRCRA